MAPEVMLARPYNEKADIFSLACCITEVGTSAHYAVQKLEHVCSVDCDFARSAVLRLSPVVSLHPGLHGSWFMLMSDDWLPQVFSKSIAAMTVTVTGEPDEFEKIAHKVQCSLTLHHRAHVAAALARVATPTTPTRCRDQSRRLPVVFHILIGC